MGGPDTEVIEYTISPNKQSQGGTMDNNFEGHLSSNEKSPGANISTKQNIFTIKMGGSED